MSQKFDVIVVGAGPGGYVCAIRAAQLGLKTAVVEKEKLGGTCLNVGCIPSKALLESSELVHSSRVDFQKHGIEINQLKVSLSKMMKRKEGIVSDLVQGIGFLFKKNKITPIHGAGQVSSGKVTVHTKEGQIKTYEAKSIVIATGSVPREISGLEFDKKQVISSTEALSLKHVPKNLVIVGAGFIGVEMGSIWARLGSKVTVVDQLPTVCSTLDVEVSSALQKILEEQGLKFLLEREVVDFNNNQLTLLSKEGKKQKLKADLLLVAAGRVPFTEGLEGLKKDKRGFICVDENYQTNLPGVYAIGDVIPVGPMLAHKAEEEGVAVAEILAGKPGHVNYRALPGIVYTHPEAASLGYTEEELKKQGMAYNKGKYPFAANGRAKALGQTQGFVKILADKKTDTLLGAHILGPRASDLISELVIGMEFHGSSEDMARSFHAHPTLSEVIREAALDVHNRARQK